MATAKSGLNANREKGDLDEEKMDYGRDSDTASLPCISQLSA
jgi:hypothetical protein